MLRCASWTAYAQNATSTYYYTIGLSRSPRRCGVSMPKGSGGSMRSLGRWGLLLAALVYFAVALGCLRQWEGGLPWSRLDLFSGGMLGLLALSTGVELFVGRALLASEAALREASGATYDAATLAAGAFLSAGDALVYLDYGHWHLAPALERAPLQSLGLLLGVAAVAWLLWTDAHLTAYFTGGSTPRLMTHGPFRYVRHPRYAGVLAVRAALALSLASVVAWGLAGGRLVVPPRRVRPGGAPPPPPVC